MTQWKKVVSAITSAALLASLLGAVAAPAVLAAADNSSVLDCAVALDTTACSQVADGASQVVLAAAPTDTDSGTVGIQPPAAGYKLVVTLDNNTFSAASANWVLSTDKKTASFTFTGSNNTASTDRLTITAPSAAGTTTASASLQSPPDITTGLVSTTSYGSLTITWVASANLNVSEANSRVKIVGPTGTCAVASGEFTETAVASASATPTLTNVATLCVLVKTAAGTTVTSGTVSATISPVGLLGAGSQVASATIGANGVASILIKSSGVAGAASITISVTSNSVTTTFAPKTFTFTGSLAKFTLSNVRYAFLKGALIPAGTAIAKIVATDAAGNALACDTSWVAKETGTALLGGLSVANTHDLDADGVNDCTVDSAAVTPATAGSTTVIVQNAASGPTVVSNAVTFYVSTVQTTIAVSFDKSVVVPGGIAAVSVTLKDAAGRIAPDGVTVTAFANAGNVISSAATATATTKNGIAKFTYIAPNNAGVATVTAFQTDEGLVGSGSITIGASVSAGHAASALGVTTSGPFSTTTKLPARGKYVTVKISFGSGAAGQHVGILVAKKNSSGVWSSFVLTTGRIANSNGDVYYYWRSSSAAWLSIRGQLAATKTNAVQARWR